MADLNIIDFGDGVEQVIADTTARQGVTALTAEVAGTQGLISSTVGWTGKNKLKLIDTVATRTNNGVVFTVYRNEFGEVTKIVANGTATSNAYIPLYSTNGQYYQGTFIGKRVILSGCPEGGGENKYFIDAYRAGTKTGTGGTARDNGGGVEFDWLNDGSGTAANLTINVANGATVNNLEFYPMIRDARISDATYEPHHDSVEACKYNTAAAIRNRAHNLLQNKAITQTVGEITFTVNADKSVTVNGTTGSTARALYLNNLFSLETGHEYILSDGLAEHNTSRFLRLGNATDGYLIGTGTGDNVKFTATATMTARISVEANTTVNNLTFYPMIRDITDTDSTFAPHAMTNRELTTGKLAIGRVISSSDNLNNVTENGVYYITTAPTNSPEAKGYCKLIVLRRDDTDIHQMVITGSIIYTRRLGGSPASWGNWYKYSGTELA